MYNIHLLPPETELLARKEAERMDFLKQNVERTKQSTMAKVLGKKDRWEVEPLTPISY